MAQLDRDWRSKVDANGVPLEVALHLNRADGPRLAELATALRH